MPCAAKEGHLGTDCALQQEEPRDPSSQRLVTQELPDQPINHESERSMSESSSSSSSEDSSVEGPCIVSCVSYEAPEFISQFSKGGVGDIRFPSLEFLKMGGSDKRFCPQHDLKRTKFSLFKMQPSCAKCIAESGPQRHFTSVYSAYRLLYYEIMLWQKSIGDRIEALKVRSIELCAEIQQSKSPETTDTMEQNAADGAAVNRPETFVENLLMTKTILRLLTKMDNFLDSLRRQEKGWELLVNFNWGLKTLLRRVVLKADYAMTLIHTASDLQHFTQNCEALVSDFLEPVPYNKTPSTLPAKDEGINKTHCPGKRCLGKLLKQSSQILEAKAGWSTAICDLMPVNETLTMDTLAALRLEFENLTEQCPQQWLEDPGPKQMLHNIPQVKPYDFDDVFVNDSDQKSEAPILEVSGTRDAMPVSDQLLRRVMVHFPQDDESAVVIDVHVTETDLLVMADNNDHCLKVFDLTESMQTLKMSYPVMGPLSLCSAGWGKVMVIGIRCSLVVLDLRPCGIQQVAWRRTGIQYQGLARLSESLIAAQCPGVANVHLLDLKGQVVHELQQLDFSRIAETRLQTSSQKTRLQKSSQKTRLQKASQETRPQKASQETRLQKASQEARPKKVSQEIRPQKASKKNRLQKASQETPPQKASQENRPQAFQETHLQNASQETRLQKAYQETHPQKASQETHPPKASQEIRPQKASTKKRLQKPSQETPPQNDSQENRPQNAFQETRLQKATQEARLKKASQETRLQEASQETRPQKVSQENRPQNSSQENRRQESSQENTRPSEHPTQPNKSKNSSNQPPSRNRQKRHNANRLHHHHSSTRPDGWSRQCYSRSWKNQRYLPSYCDDWSHYPTHRDYPPFFESEEYAWRHYCGERPWYQY